MSIHMMKNRFTTNVDSTSQGPRVYDPIHPAEQPEQHPPKRSLDKEHDPWSPFKQMALEPLCTVTSIKTTLVGTGLHMIQDIQEAW